MEQFGGHAYWRLVEPGGSGAEAANIVARDTVEINVEDTIYPFKTEVTDTAWVDRPTYDWVGLDVADAWHMDKTLVDYIVTPNDKGKLATIHPDMAGGTRASADKPDSPSTDTYGTDVTLEFTYTFDRRGGNSYGYVQADKQLKNNLENDDRRVDPGSVTDTDRVKLSFVSNSGIKFSGEEVAILDVEKMIELAGGIAAFTLNTAAPRGPKGIDNQGRVDIMRTMAGDMIHDGHVYDFEDENLSQLMSGVLYDGSDYAKMDDFFPADPANVVSQDFINTLCSNLARQGSSNTMEVILSGSSLTVKIDGDQVYHDPNAGFNLGQFSVQSHWASGVVFSEMDVVEH